jgi:hypothetical protein
MHRPEVTQLVLLVLLIRKMVLNLPGRNNLMLIYDYVSICQELLPVTEGGLS